MLHASALAFQAVKYAGVAYLLDMAVRAWRDHGALQVSEVVTLVVFVGHGLAAQVRRQVVDRPGVLAWMRRTFAVGFVGLGARLATADR